MYELDTIYKAYPLNILDVAKAANVHRVRVQQLTPAMSADDLALMVGRTWRFKPEALTWMKNRENRRK